MKKLGILLGVLSIALAHSQTFNYYKVGQDFNMNDKACLVIKNDYRTLLHIFALEKYEKVKAVKLVGFNKSKLDLDSLFDLMSDLTEIKYLMFEDCDLYNLPQSLAFMPQLQEVRVLKNCVFDENYLYTCLKDNPISTLYFVKNETDVVTDSLHLLKKLSQINVSSNNTYTKSNRVNTIRISHNRVPHDINVAYYGSLFKEEPKKITVRKPVNETTAQAKFRNEKLSCIKQPIPGININDTAYAFNSKDNVSLLYKSGTIIQIDKNSFVNKDGSAYNGPVSLSYREFRNPVEIMLSGIPMTTKSENGEAIFRSGGMYEAYAYDNKGNALNTRSDSSLKINFALTDTASDFKFYTLQDNGNWQTTKNSVSTTFKVGNAKTFTITKAVKDYLNYLYAAYVKEYDSTTYEDRFADTAYLYTYRKDNLRKYNDSVFGRPTYLGFFGKEKGFAKGMYKIKYRKLTKDKEVIFTIVPARKDQNYYIPAYIAELFNHDYVYTGDLSKAEFINTFCRRKYYWDLRQNSMGNSLDLKLKSTTGFVNLSAKAIYLQSDNTYKVAKHTNRAINTKLSKYLAFDSKKFKRHAKKNDNEYNRLNPHKYYNTPEQAFAHCQKYQNTEEKAMDLRAWKKYVDKVNPYGSLFTMQQNNEVGMALINSGLGVRNIDTYIHSGQMENILVNYNAPADSLVGGYNAVLFKSINTSYPLAYGANGKNSFSGYYFKNHANYVIRFSDNGYMQVTKPKESSEQKKNSSIYLPYTNQYLVKNLNSNDITKLILE